VVGTPRHIFDLLERKPELRKSVLHFEFVVKKVKFFRGKKRLELLGMFPRLQTLVISSGKTEFTDEAWNVVNGLKELKRFDLSCSGGAVPVEFAREHPLLEEFRWSKKVFVDEDVAAELGKLPNLKKFRTGDTNTDLAILQQKPPITSI